MLLSWSLLEPDPLAGRGLRSHKWHPTSIFQAQNPGSSGPPALPSSARRPELIHFRIGQPEPRSSPAIPVGIALLLFAILTALVYRLRGGGFAVNDWRPAFLHSRYIAFLLQTICFIAAMRLLTQRPGWHGLVAGILWLLAVTPAWGAWFDIGTHQGPQNSDPAVAWIHSVLDVLFGPLDTYGATTREAWRDALGMSLRGLFFLPLLAFSHLPFSWKPLGVRAALWLPLLPACYALHHHLWTAGPNPELIAGLILGVLTFPGRKHQSNHGKA